MKPKILSPPILVVDDEPLPRQATTRMVSVLGARTLAAESLAGAQRALGRVHALAGAILDVRLPDGHGYDLIEPLRERHGIVPILVITGEEDLQHVQAAQLRGAEYLRKPVPLDNVRAFVDRCLQTTDPLSHFARNHGLSLRETELLRHATTVDSLERIPPMMGITPSTAKTYRSRILRKTGFPSMAAVVRVVLTQGR